MNISFCTNRKALQGLRATLLSLVRNCSDSGELNIWFLCADLFESDKSHLSSLLEKANFSGLHKFIDFDPVEAFKGFASLHGDLTTYGRLLLADLIDEDQVLYLDADLIVELDVLEIKNFSFGNYAIAAVGGGEFRYALGNDFYVNKVGIPPGTEYFNAGVLLLDLQEWRNQKIKEKCMQIAAQFSLNLPSHDQSLLNIYCLGQFAKLPANFNCSWTPNDLEPIENKRIIHFIGVPKPWDPMAFLLHNGYNKWKEYHIYLEEPFFKNDLASNLHRIWSIRKSYARRILQKFEVIRFYTIFFN